VSGKHFGLDRVALTDRDRTDLQPDVRLEDVEPVVVVRAGGTAEAVLTTEDAAVTHRVDVVDVAERVVGVLRAVGEIRAGDDRLERRDVVVRLEFRAVDDTAVDAVHLDVARLVCEVVVELRDAKVDEVAGLGVVDAVDALGLVELDGGTDLLCGRAGLEEGDATEVLVDAVGAVLFVLFGPVDDLLIRDVVLVAVLDNLEIGLADGVAVCDVVPEFALGVVRVCREIIGLRDIVVLGDPALDLAVRGVAQFDPLDFEVRVGRGVALAGILDVRGVVRDLRGVERALDVVGVVVARDRLVRDELVDTLAVAVGAAVGSFRRPGSPGLPRRPGPSPST